MKKSMLLVLAVPLLAMALTSCDADLRSQFADLMGNVTGNVFIDSGMVASDTSDAEAALDAIKTLNSFNGIDKLDEVLVDWTKDETATGDNALLDFYNGLVEEEGGEE